MNFFTVEPRDPLFVRDGRPMNPGPGSARSLAFPLPTTLAGLVRTRLGSDPTGKFLGNATALLYEVSIMGPFLCKLKPDSGAPNIFVAAPRDIVWFSTNSESKCGYRLLPMKPDLVSDVVTDLPSELRLVGPAVDPGPAKAVTGPTFWSLHDLLTWLAQPKATLEDITGPTLTREERVHVAIDSAKGTAEDGMLFSTESLRFENWKEHFALLGAFEDSKGRSMTDDVVNLGGERRVSFLRQAPQISWPPAIPLPIRQLKPGALARIVLLSPIIFPEGAIPRNIAGAQVVAAIVPRPEVVSGWDLATQLPKPTRRMVAAGSVYWVTVPKQDGWVESVWMKSIAPDDNGRNPQDLDRRDGFGLAIIGVA